MQRRKINEENPPASTRQAATPITSGQKIIISQLQQDRKTLVNRINKPYSMVASSFIVGFLLLHRYSPLHGLLTEYSGIVRVKHTKELYNALDPQLQLQVYLDHYTIRQQYEEVQQSYYKYFKKMLALEDIAEQMELHGHDNHAILRQNLIVHYLNMCSVRTRDIPHMNEVIPRLQQEAATLSTKELFIRAEKEYAAVTQFIATVLESIPAILTSAEVRKTTLAFNSVALIALDYLAINNLIRHLMPNGGFSLLAAPTLNMNAWVSEADANAYIVKYKKYNELLAKQAKFNANIARLLMLIFIPLAITLFSFSEPAELLIYTGLTLLSIGLNNFMQEIKETYDQYSFNLRDTTHNWVFKSALTRREKLYQDFSADCPIEIVTHRGNTLEQSFFEITFVRYKALSSKAVGKLLKNCLLHYGINLPIENDKIIYIPANLKMAKGKLQNIQAMLSDCAEKTALQNIKNMFLASLERKLALFQFNKQLFIILKHFGISKEDVLIIPQYEAQGLPIDQYEIQIPQQKRNLLEVVRRVLPMQIASENEYEMNINIIITGREPLSKTVFSQLEKDLEAAVPKRVADNNIIPDSSYAPLSTPKRRKHKKIQPANDADSGATDQPQRRVLVFPSGIYDSESKVNHIHPLLIGKTHDKASLTKTKHFVSFDLRPTLFANGKKDATYIQAKNMVDFDCPAVKRQHGGQGLVFARGKEYDQDGNLVDTSMKGRLFGGNGMGDTRIYAISEKSDDDGDDQAVLHRFVCFKPGAH